MNSQVILAGIACSLTGTTLISAIHEAGPAGMPFNGSLVNNRPLFTPLPASSITSPAVLQANPRLVLESANPSGPQAVTTTPITPKIYVTHPWVIALLVPGEVDPGIAQSSRPKRAMDDIAINPHLRWDPLK